MAKIAILSPQELGNLKVLRTEVNRKAYSNCERVKCRPNYWKPEVQTPRFAPILVARVSPADEYIVDGVTRAVFSYIKGFYAEMFAVENRSEIPSVVPRVCLTGGDLEKTLARFDQFQPLMKPTGSDEKTVASLAARYFNANFTSDFVSNP